MRVWGLQKSWKLAYLFSGYELYAVNFCMLELSHMIQIWSREFVYVYIHFMLRCFSCVQFFVILWTETCQAPLSMAFSRQEYWSGLPCPPPWDLPDPRIEPASLMATSATWDTIYTNIYNYLSFDPGLFICLFSNCL